jgi:hypothetical protein
LLDEIYYLRTKSHCVNKSFIITTLQKTLFGLFPPFWCQQQGLDLNPQPWDDDVSVLPLCYNWLPQVAVFVHVQLIMSPSISKIFKIGKNLKRALGKAINRK